jgi:hypothetical protein
MKRVVAVRPLRLQALRMAIMGSRVALRRATGHVHISTDRQGQPGDGATDHPTIEESALSQLPLVLDLLEMAETTGDADLRERSALRSRELLDAAVQALARVSLDPDELERVRAMIDIASRMGARVFAKLDESPARRASEAAPSPDSPPRGRQRYR